MTTQDKDRMARMKNTVAIAERASADYAAAFAAAEHKYCQARSRCDVLREQYIELLETVLLESVLKELAL